MKKHYPIRTFCETCRQRTVFNKTRNEDIIVCSRCGTSKRSEMKVDTQQTLFTRERFK